MKYVAFLRGINVGGNNKVEMSRLKSIFEKVGLKNVSTYINSGNIIFDTDLTDQVALILKFESAIQREFGFEIKVVLRTQENIKSIVAELPKSWMNNAEMKCDVMFLWEAVDSKEILNQITIKPELDEVKYVPGAILWRVDRQNVTRSGLLRIVGTPLYKQMTIRNCNTVRKLAEIMSSS